MERSQGLYVLNLLLLGLLALLYPSTQLEQGENHNKNAVRASVRIAIVGGGVGGTSCAYYLRELFGTNASITLFESNDVGGRLATVPIGNQMYEIGGTIIHPRNMYMKNFVRDFGLKERKQAAGGTMGIYNGEEFVFTSSSWSAVTFCRLLWRYGTDLFRMNRVIGELLDKFARIYTLQDAGESFQDIEGVMRAMGGDDFIAWLQTPVEDILREQGFSERFISEMVAIATRANYGQDPDMMGFAGMVSLAGAMPGLWSIEGGNKQIAEEFLKRSGATLIPSRVDSIERLAGDSPGVRPRFRLRLLDENRNTETDEDFDVVVVATPLQDGQSNLEFVGFDAPVTANFTGDYQHTVATLVHGKPRAGAFGLAATEALPSQVMTNCDVSQQIRTLATNFPVDYDPATFNASAQVYKVFSTESLSLAQLDDLFEKHAEVVRRDWLAYPYYMKRSGPFPSFVLAEGVFYPNAVEWAASAMEMGVIGGRNAAILAHQYWTGTGSAGKTVKPQMKGEL